MSYNITSFKVKELTNLVIFTPAFYDGGEGWQPEKVKTDGITRFSWDESVYVEGKLVRRYLHVSKIDWCGECSGTAMEWCLKPALLVSKGVLVCSLAWEGGDLIERLTVKDGHLKFEEI
jgi:hypothetical protein